MALINSLCAMLRTTPFHREKYSRLIVGVIIQFYQRCSHRFQALVSKGGTEGHSSPSLAAQWAQNAELGPCLSELFVAEVSSLWAASWDRLNSLWLPGSCNQAAVMQTGKSSRIGLLGSLFYG